MTDVVKLAHKLYRKINQQQVPDRVGWVDLVHWIEDAIEAYYSLNGKALQFSDEMFEMDESGNAATFKDDLKVDEQQWVLLQAQIYFFQWVQASVNTDKSYTTDAMSVTHGDKPYEHIADTLEKLVADRDRVWYQMNRYNTLGVV